MSKKGDYCRVCGDVRGRKKRKNRENSFLMIISYEGSHMTALFGRWEDGVR